MGVFFEKKERSTKPIIAFRILIAIPMAIFLILLIFKEFDFLYLRFIFILAGIGSIVDGLERYFHKESSKSYIVDYGLAILYIILSFSI